MDRYAKNGIFDTTAAEKIARSRVCVIGCGGLGGYVIEMLGRVGIGTIRAIDGDVFDETNLNRQLLSHTGNIGVVKAHEVEKRMALVNPLIKIEARPEFFTRENATEILKDIDVAVDALDSIETRLLLQEVCETAGVPLVHGAIAGWYGQVTTIMPGDKTLSSIYGEGVKTGVEKEIGNPSFTPAMIASMQVSEVMKLVTGQGECLSRKILHVDLLDNEYIVIDI